MASLSPRLAVFALIMAAQACSPEARRTRDGGPGADPGNKVLIDAPPANPRAADTTLQRAFSGSATDSGGREPRHR